MHSRRGSCDAVSRVPGVSSAAYAFQSLLTGGGWGMGFTIEGYQPRPGEDAGSMCNAVSPGFFRTLGIPLLAGREFTERDARVVPLPEGWPYRVAVVNESFVERYFKGANPDRPACRDRREPGHADANRDRRRGEGLQALRPSARTASPRFSSRICRRDSWRT